jgi:3'(2'), 5'-bisphosphate nucleotidase
MSFDLTKLRDKVVTIAIEAGNIMLEIYKKDFVQIKSKKDFSPLTEADTKVNIFIKNQLENLNFNFPIISEELLLEPFSSRSKWVHYWIIDPLDGTKEFIKKNGEFTINIALINNRLPVIGVVYAPALKDLYFASKNSGAFKRNFVNNQNIQIKVKKTYQNILVVANSRSHQSEQFDEFVSYLKEKNKFNISIKLLGSSLKICQIAEGLVDIYPRLGPTSEWDIAAAHCVLMEAGGYILDLDSQKNLIYNAKDSIINSNFVATYLDKKCYLKN